MKQFLGLLALFVLILSCERNHEPVVSQISYEPDQASAGAVIELKVDASDEDGDPLTYVWESSFGEFLSSSDLDEVVWKAPRDGEGQAVTISVIVSDGEYEVSREVIFSLAEPLLGSIEGYVYFPNQKKRVKIRQLEAIIYSLQLL